MASLCTVRGLSTWKVALTSLVTRASHSYGHPLTRPSPLSIPASWSPLAAPLASIGRVSGPAVRSASAVSQVQSDVLASSGGDSEAQLDKGNPLDSYDYFGVRSLVTTKDLFAARVHLGHKRGLRNELMTPYLYGCREDVDIIDLDQTLSHLNDALNVLAHMVYREGVILFISAKRETMPLVEQAATLCGEYANCRPWKPGIFTNSERMYGSVVRLPDTCLFLHTQTTFFRQHSALADCHSLAIPTIALVDTNCDPRLVTYPIPANDDSPLTCRFFLALFRHVIDLARSRRQKDDALLAS